MLGTEELKNDNAVLTPGPGDSTDVGFPGYGRISVPTL